MCETCEFYDWDEYLDAYVCDMKLDEDEMLNFISGNERSCPYYRFYDEYKSVAKQNWYWMKIYDAHTHIFPEKIAETAQKRRSDGHSDDITVVILKLVSGY